MRPFDILSSALLCAAHVSAAIPAISGFRLTWADDFNGRAGSLPSAGNWIIDRGTSYPGGGPANWGTGEIQSYTAERRNIRLDGRGALEIQAHRDSRGRWTSARIETKRSNFLAPRGRKMRIQARLMLPDLDQSNGIGYWPAFWTLGARYRGNFGAWPRVGEFDIMENVNSINGVWNVFHCGVNPGGTCNEPNGVGSGPRGCPGSRCQGNWHTYTLEVDRTRRVEALRWFVDGRRYFEIFQNQFPASVWKEAVHSSHFVLLNLAMGGAFPNGVYGGQTPLRRTKSGGIYKADYVAVYHSR